MSMITLLLLGILYSFSVVLRTSVSISLVSYFYLSRVKNLTKNFSTLAGSARHSTISRNYT